MKQDIENSNLKEINGGAFVPGKIIAGKKYPEGAEKSLVGILPGVKTVAGSGDPDAESQIRIR